MKISLARAGSLILFVGVAIAVAYFTADQWKPLLNEAATAPDAAHLHDEHDEHAEHESLLTDEPKMLKLSPAARKNLGVVSRGVSVKTYWRKVQIPGTIVDRPGRSDRGVTSPAVGVVSAVHAFPGETVRPGDRLFTIQLFSEYLQRTQKDLFSAAKEVQLIEGQLERLQPLADSGGIAGTKLIDLQNQLRRQEALIQSHRQDLLTRGLSPEQISAIAAGQFVSSIDVYAPPPLPADKDDISVRQIVWQSTAESERLIAYEVQDLVAELGQQVQAGQLLSTLSDHSSLYIEGHAFKREAPYLEAAAQNGWDVVVEFAEDSADHWPALEQAFEVQYISNSIDPASRTFDFFIPLTNQAHTYQKDGETFVVWRFRPGQRVRLHVPVEQLSEVIVLPSEAVVRDGPEAYVFVQNGSLFKRVAVHIQHEDRLNVVLENDGSLGPGMFVAQSSAASLNRVLKAQAASGMRADVHVHADGTVHAAH